MSGTWQNQKKPVRGTGFFNIIG